MSWVSASAPRLIARIGNPNWPAIWAWLRANAAPWTLSTGRFALPSVSRTISLGYVDRRARACSSWAGVAIARGSDTWLVWTRRYLVVSILWTVGNIVLIAVIASIFG
jgi:hypothetical protein